MTTAKEMAERLNGRQYRNEITLAEEKEARESGLIVLFGASDDLCELRGVIGDEAGCYDGGDLYLTENGFCELDEDEEPPANARLIHAWWCLKQPNGETPFWYYTTDIPHETFRIMEDDEVYCIGIVFRAEDIIESQQSKLERATREYESMSESEREFLFRSIGHVFELDDEIVTVDLLAFGWRFLGIKTGAPHHQPLYVLGRPRLLP